MPTVAVIVAFVAGVCYAFVAVPAQTSLQEELPADVRGRVIAVGLSPLWKTGAPSQSIHAVDALIPRLRTLPEVEGAVQDVNGFDIRRFVMRDREGGGPAARADSMPTTITLEGTAPGWFAMVEVPIILGRDVQLADTIGAERNIVIGSDLAQRARSAAADELVHGVDDGALGAAPMMHKAHLAYRRAPGKAAHALLANGARQGAGIGLRNQRVALAGVDEVAQGLKAAPGKAHRAQVQALAQPAQTAA